MSSFCSNTFSSSSRACVTEVNEKRGSSCRAEVSHGRNPAGSASMWPSADMALAGRINALR